MTDRVEMHHEKSNSPIFVYPYQVEQMELNGWFIPDQTQNEGLENG